MRSLLGVNLPYFGGAYGHDLAPSARWPDWPVETDAMKSYRPLLEARALGLEAVRIWLCEGSEGLLLDGRERVRGVHPRLLEAIRILEEGAQVTGVKIYWSLLDANSASRDGDPITRAILSDADHAAAFAEHVVAPIARALDPRVAIGLEIVNEPEVVSPACADVRDAAVPSIEWAALGRTISLARRAALAEKGDLIVTAGTGNAFLPELWRSGAELTAIDVHVYHRDGGLPSRDDLARYVDDPAIASESIPLIAGECGIPKEPGADPASICNYLWNASRDGYAAAFLWKLEGDLIDAKEPGRPWTPIGHRVRTENDKREKQAPRA